ncbi:hypothetical protein IT402_01525 [Candidatus Nomurabacteria bacterium]|nr:hypothetical protein [Candidatus Nomurabacteria bacterium]
MSPGEKGPSEFPSKEEQLKSLEEQESRARKGLKDFGLKDSDIDELIKFPEKVKDLSYIPDEYIFDIRKLAEELNKIKIRKEFLENNGNNFPEIPTEV